MTTTTLRLPGRIELLPQLRRIVRGGLAARGAVGAGLAAKAGGAAALAPVAGMWLWLKADAISGSDGDAVATWPDSSGNSRHFSGTGHAPTLKTSVLNGKPVVRNTANAYCLLVSALPTTATIHVVAIMRTAPVTFQAGITETALVGNIKSSVPAYLLMSTTARVINTLDGVAYKVLGTATIDVPFRTTETHNLATNKRSGWWNGSSVFTDVYYIITSQQNAQINLFVGYNDYFKGDIAEIIVYDSVLSAPNLAVNEAYLVSKYAL